MKRVLARLRRLGAAQRGNTLVEFALGLPLLLSIGAYGVEISNEVFSQMQLSQLALMLADNASRIGTNTGQATYQLREGDLNDVLQGARLEGAGLKLSTNGRVTISSLENILQSYSDHATDTTYQQRIHWQRCMGQMSGAAYDSTFGSVTPLVTAGSDSTYANRGTASTGMGAAPQVQATQDVGVIFVEINYLYQPLFGTMYIKNPVVLHAVASFVVRDRRDFTQIYNPVSALGTKATPSTCDLHNT